VRENIYRKGRATRREEMERQHMMCALVTAKFELKLRKISNRLCNEKSVK
jgi:hypothetical protein